MSSLAGARALVTGAGGFVGAHLVAALVRQGSQVRAFTHYNSRNDRGALDWHDASLISETEVVAGDLRDAESVTRAMVGMDVVFHLGALIAIPYSYVNPRGFFETNVLGTLNVAQATLDHGVERVVHTSTSETYGTARQTPMTESHPLEPQSPYAASKVGADKLMESYRCAYELPVVVLRPFNTYGPFQSARAVIPTIISQALDGGELMLGSLEPRRDLLYVDDTVAAFLAAATSPDAPGRTIHIGTGVDFAIGEIVEIVGELMGRELVVRRADERVRPAASEVQRLLCDASLARELLGWEPATEFRDGLARTIEWIRDNQSRFRAREYAV
jgi:NAD dependent epimerase/dehydratase